MDRRARLHVKRRGRGNRVGNLFMYLSILRSGIFLMLAASIPAAAQPELFFAAGVDSTGWAQAQSNADGHVLIESPQYPHGLWLHLADDAGDALAGLQVEYQERPDSLVAIRCVDPVGALRETLVWTRPEGDALRLTIQPKEVDDLPAGLASIDWQIDASVESLLDPVEETRLIGWEAVAAFLRERWQAQTGRVAVQFNARTLAIEVDRQEDVETLVAHLQQAPYPADAALGATYPLKMQIFAGNLGLQEGVILRVSWFDDPNLEYAVRKVLGRPQGRLIPEDVASLTEFRADGIGGIGIRSLAGIEYFTTLLDLELYSNQIVDLTPLNQLKNLKRLGLSFNQIVDLTPISQLNSLNLLKLDGNRIVDLTPLNQLKNLRALGLGRNQIVDLTPISQLNSLRFLVLDSNQVVDLTPISQLNSLRLLFLDSNQIVDLTPISQLKNLQWLHLSYNQITDLTPLNQLKNLLDLFLFDNRIADLTPLNQLKNLRVLWLDGNPLSDQARTEQIPALKARGVTVHY